MDRPSGFCWFFQRDRLIFSGIKTGFMQFKNVVGWFEIPATQLDRAQKFYETIFDCELSAMDFPNIRMRVFPAEQGMVSGALCHAQDFYQPGQQGILVYFSASPDLQAVLGKVEEAGGHIIVPKTQISPEIGYMAVFADTEGNRLALHSIS